MKKVRNVSKFMKSVEKIVVVSFIPMLRTQPRYLTIFFCPGKLIIHT